MATRGTRKAPKGGRRRKASADSASNAGKDDSISFEVYQSQGRTFHNTGEYAKAIRSYTKALEMRADHKECLIARSKCYLQLEDHARALEDANKTLDDNSNFIKGLLQKADAYYHMSQFEYSLMWYHRGNKLRPEIQEFRLGIQKSQEAIDNSIGEKSGIKLEKKGDLSFFIKEQLSQAGKKESKKKSREDNEKEKRRKQDSSMDSKTVKQLLGQLYDDKVFLEKLLNESENASNQSEANQAVTNLATNCLNYLDSRTEFWRQQQPTYSRQRDKKRREKLGAEHHDDKDPTQWILDNLEQIDNAQSEGKYAESLKQAKRVLKKTETYNENKVPTKLELTSNLYSLIGNAHLELGEYDLAIQHHQKDYNIAKQKKLDYALSRALDNLGRVYIRIGQYNKAINYFNEKLPLSESELENAWLYHEIGRCHLEQDEGQQAKEFGVKALEAAERSNDQLWQLNTSILIAQAEVKLGEPQMALESFERSLEMSKSLKDTAATEAIQKAIDDIHRKAAATDNTADEDGDDGDENPNNTSNNDDNDGFLKQLSENDDSIEYVVSVKTGDVRGAGTDANIFIILYGDQGETKRVPLTDELNKKKDLFEKGETDQFKINASDIGKVSKVRIGHDGTDAFSGWYLDEVQVRVHDEQYTFPCYAWLDKDDSDGGKLEIELGIIAPNN